MKVKKRKGIKNDNDAKLEIIKEIFKIKDDGFILVIKDDGTSSIVSIGDPVIKTNLTEVLLEITGEEKKTKISKYLFY